MKNYNWTSRIYNNTRQVKYGSLGVLRILNYDWMREWMIWDGWHVHRNGWYGMDDFNSTERQ